MLSTATSLLSCWHAFLLLLLLLMMLLLLLLLLLLWCMLYVLSCTCTEERVC